MLTPYPCAHASQATPYIHTCMHAYIHTYIHTYVHTYIHSSIHTYIPTCIHTYIHACMHACIHTYIHTYIRNGTTYICTFACELSKRRQLPLMLGGTACLTLLVYYGIICFLRHCSSTTANLISCIVRQF